VAFAPSLHARARVVEDPLTGRRFQAMLSLRALAVYVNSHVSAAIFAGRCERLLVLDRNRSGNSCPRRASTSAAAP
jgi:hypothetical protein